MPSWKPCMTARRWAAARSTRACHSSAEHSCRVMGETLSCIWLSPGSGRANNVASVAGKGRMAEAAPCRSPLPAERALGVDVERIQRLARRHEQAVPLEAAEADIGGALRQRDAADRLAVRVEHHDAVEFGRAHAPAAPQVAVDVAAHAIRCAAGAGIDKHAL